jgi:hypothetical protein
MRGFRLTREQQVPKGSTKITDKESGSAAYTYVASNGKPGACVFWGKSQKPLWRYYFQSEAERERKLRNFFEASRKHAESVKARRDERKAWVPDYKVGELLRTCWGYDQTNVEYFEVVEVRGKHVVLREIAQETKQDGFMAGKCVPLPGQYLKPRYEGDERGKPIRRLAGQSGVKIDDVRSASRCKPKMVGGVPVYDPAYYSWGH